MLIDIIDPKKLSRALLYAAYLIIAVLLQEQLFSRVSLAGAHAFFMPVIVLAAGFFEGGLWGGVFGLLAGLLTDVCYSESTVVFTVLFALTGFLGGVLTEYYVNRRFFSFVFAGAAALVLAALCQLVRPLLVSGAEPAALARMAGLQCLFSLPFTVLAYFPCRAISRVSRKDS